MNDLERTAILDFAQEYFTPCNWVMVCNNILCSNCGFKSFDLLEYCPCCDRYMANGHKMIVR